MTAVATLVFAAAHDAKLQYPESVEPDRALDDIQAIVKQNHLAEWFGVPELARGRDALLVRRLLSVRSELPSLGNYLVVELEDFRGKPVATLGMTRRGELMGVNPASGIARRPISLSKASALVRARRGRDPLKIEYVYFDNLAEGGISYFCPLVAVQTERGTIYLNSKSEAFAEEGSPLIDELGASGPVFTVPGVRSLRLLGRW